MSRFLFSVFAIFFINKKSEVKTSLSKCDRDWIRTSTPFPAPPPQGGASTNFATRPMYWIANLMDMLKTVKTIIKFFLA